MYKSVKRIILIASILCLPFIFEELSKTIVLAVNNDLLVSQLLFVLAKYLLMVIVLVPVVVYGLYLLGFIEIIKIENTNYAKRTKSE